MSPRRAKAIADRAGDDPGVALREHLIEAALQLIGTAPISAITTRRIARAAGVSEGVLYNYFGDKAELIVAALRRRHDELVAQFNLRMPEAGSGTVEGNLVALVAAVTAMHDGLLPVFVGLLNEPVLLQRFIDEVHREPLGPFREIATYIAEEQQLGRLARGFDVAAVTGLLVGTGLMEAFGRHLVPAHAPPAHAGGAPAVVAILMNGVKP